MDNFSAGITFMRANPPTVGHFLIIDKLHNLNVNKKYIYLSHSHDNNKNPLPYYEKYSFMKTFVEEKYDDIEVINSEARTIIEALNEIYKEGCNDVTIVLGSDRVKEFSDLISKYNGVTSKKTGEIIYQFNNIEFIQAGEDRDEDSNNISSMSASKQRKLAAENNFEEFAKGVPTEDLELKKELYNSLRKSMNLKEGILDKIKRAFDKEDPIVKYYEIGPITKRWWLRDETGMGIYMKNTPMKYATSLGFAPEDYINAPVYLISNFSDEVQKNIMPVGKPDEILGDIGAEIVDAYTKQFGQYKGFFVVVKVIFKNEKAYNRINEKFKKEVMGIFSPDDYYNKSTRFGDGFTVYNFDRFFEMPSWEDLEKEGFPEKEAKEIEYEEK